YENFCIDYNNYASTSLQPQPSETLTDENNLIYENNYTDQYVYTSTSLQTDQYIHASTSSQTDYASTSPQTDYTLTSSQFPLIFVPK
ncbi:5498_t:CDS:2, partial [Dentiscutata erythropus]